jgi:hypothetical protein
MSQLPNETTEQLHGVANIYLLLLTRNESPRCGFVLKAVHYPGYGFEFHVHSIYQESHPMTHTNIFHHFNLLWFTEWCLTLSPHYGRCSYPWNWSTLLQQQTELFSFQGSKYVWLIKDYSPSVFRVS